MIMNKQLFTLIGTFVNVGALNWGLVKLFNFDLITWLFTLIGIVNYSTWVFGIIGLTGAYALYRIIPKFK